MNDKLKHFLAGIIIYGLSFAVMYGDVELYKVANRSLAFVVLAGVGKEGYDKITGRGHASSLDAWATILLPMVISIVLNFI